MKCPYCLTRLGGNPYGEGRLCPRCGYVEVLDDKAPVAPEVPEEPVPPPVSVLDDDPPDDGPDLPPATFDPPVRHTPRRSLSKKKGKKK